MKKILIGVAWPYAYSPMHIGNLYGSLIPADFFRRFRNLIGDDVVMVSGSDCFGTPVTIEADLRGVKPEKVANEVHEANSKMIQDLKIGFSLFTKTSTENHKKVVQELFLNLLRKGYILKQSTKQLYSESDGKFLQDRYVEGVCPFCKSDRARGDQCDGCGRVLDALEIINPKSKISGESLIVKETENYFIDLAKLQPKIEDYINSKKGIWPDWIIKESSGWFNEGLRARAITRDMEYGVPIPVSEIPDDMKLIDIEKKVFYVWFEAVIGYLSATIECSPDAWKDYWLNKDAETYYFIGEDNLVFHTINWPAQLIGSGQDYNLPTEVFTKKFLLLENDKLSKGRNWVVYSEDIINKYSLDAFRFYMAYIMTGNNQANFIWDDFMNVNNGVFLAKIGNLVNRVLVFTTKNFSDSQFSLLRQGFGGQAILNSQCDKEVREKIEETFASTKQKFAKSEVRSGLLDIVNLCEFGNEYLTKKEFWKLVKEDFEACRQVVYSALCLASSLRIMLAPIIPDFCGKLNVDMGFKEEDLISKIGEDKWVYQDFPVDNIINPDLKPLVARIEEEQIKEEKEKLVH